ncbi:MAG: phage tail tape measure protein [Phycisphaerae bacterium]
MADTKGIRAGRAFVELGVSDKLTKGLQAAEKRLKAFGEGLRSVGTKLAAIGGTALTALFGTAKTFADMGDSLDEMSARTGVSVETLSELGFAAELAGADMETLETGIRKMQKTVSEAIGGSKSAADALAQLGLSVADLKGLSPEQQFKLLADRISQIEDPTARAAAAMEIFGKSGTRLLPLIADGAKGLAKFQEQARALGLTISTQAAKDASVLADALDTLWKVIKQAVFSIGSALAPTITELAGKVTRAVVAFSEWIKQNKAIVVTVFQVAAGVAAAGVALVALGFLVSGLGAALGGLATIVTGIGTAFGVIGGLIAALVSPIGLAITAVAALGTAILVYTGAGADALAWLGEQFAWLRDSISKVIGGITDALAAGDITLAAQILWLALKLAWQEGVAALNRAWLEAKRFFIGTAQAMWFGALAAAQQVFHALEVAWIETTAFLSKTWTNFTSDVQETWHLVQNWLTKRWIDAMNLFGDLTDEQAAAAKQMADQDFADTAAGIEQRRSGALTEREQRRQSERNQSAAVNEATLAEIGKQFDEAQAALDSATDSRVAETKRALAEARKQLDEAIAAARAKREAADAGGGPPRRKLKDPLDGLEDRLAGLGNLVAQKISVTGTFNALGAQGLGAGDAEERTARATEQTAKHTKRLADAAATGGLKFA